MSAPMALRKSVEVARSPADAFRVFTEGISSWWPTETHSVSAEAATAVVLEPGEGGRIYERTAAGEEHDWGRITEWNPPERLAFTWHPGRGEDTAQLVEVRFAAAGEGTRVELVHTGWERLGSAATELFGNYDRGWQHLLEDRFAVRP